METVKTIGKILSFLVYFVSATLFFYACCQLGFARYTVADDINSASHILTTIYLPVIYALLSLTLVIITQALIIPKRSANTKRLFSIALMVFFAIMLGGSLLMLAYGIVRIPSNTVNTDPTLWIISLCPVFALSIIEIILGIISYLKWNKIVNDEEEKEEKEPGRPA